ncbi:unnamed protein product [Ectocarpus sp. CCAP 1310/34]|nr:unnamed protein product [Ectocarpus sp. CCAP 1310/34]
MGQPLLVIDGEERGRMLFLDGMEVEADPRLPTCYSSMVADPSQGRWKKCEGGVEESPANTGNFTGPWKINTLEGSCGERWSEEHQGQGHAPPMPYWKWEPSACRLEEVDQISFCGVMEGRKGLLFVGEGRVVRRPKKDGLAVGRKNPASSTRQLLTGEMIDTLAVILRATRVEYVPMTGKTYSACDGALTLSWYRNDYLDTRTDGFDTVHCEDPDLSASRCVVFAGMASIKMEMVRAATMQCQPALMFIADDATLIQFDTLVVNAGAHRRSGGLEAYGSMMKNASEILTSSMRRLHGDNAILVVRNTVPGHGESYERWETAEEKMFSGPVDVDTALDLVEKGRPGYLWSTFGDKNKLLEEAFVAAHGSWTLLDAYSPTILRADSHPSANDGLHYCVPGPIDNWVVLLYNILLERVTNKVN